MSETKYYKHDRALVASDRIGDGTRIWAFCNVLEGAVIGADCNFGDHCYVEDNVRVGDRVTVKNGVSLWAGITIEDDVFIGPHAVFTNDVYPRSKAPLGEPARTLIRRGATIGANATIVAGRTIGRYAFIGAGAVVTKDVPDFALWFGNPARQIGYVCRAGKRLDFSPDDQGRLTATGQTGEKYLFADDRVTEIEE